MKIITDKVYANALTRKPENKPARMQEIARLVKLIRTQHRLEETLIQLAGLCTAWANEIRELKRRKFYEDNS